MNAVGANQELLAADTVTVVMGALVLVSLLFVVVSFIVYSRRIEAKQLFLILIVACLPLLSVTAVSQTSETVLPVNLCLADVFIPPAIVFLFLRRLYRDSPIHLSLWWLFGIYFLWILVSLYVGAYRSDLDVLRFANFVAIAKFWALVVYFYVILNLVEDQNDLRMFAKAWLYSETAVALLGIAGSLLYVVFHISTPMSGDFRGHGTFGNPNMFAGHIMASFFVAFIYWALGGKRWLLMTFLLIHFLAIIASASKGALVAFAFACFVFAAVLPHYRMKLLAANLIFAGLLVGSYVVSDTTKIYVDRILQLTDPEAPTYQARFTLWSGSLDTWEDNYVFGVGKGNFRLEEEEASDLRGRKMEKLGFDESSRQQSEIHSTYVSLLCETGTVGFLIFVSIMSIFVFRLLRCLVLLNSDSKSYLIVAALLAALIGMLAQGAVANVEEARGLWVLLGLIWAITESVIHHDGAMIA